MQLNAATIARAAALTPGYSGKRLVFDRRGIHHKIIPARNLAHSVANHADQKNVSVAESLYIVERLKGLGAVQSSSVARSHRAVFQAFQGAAGYEACHTMPCQLVVDNRFPHVLSAGGNRLNPTFMQRTLDLFGRCTWQPAIVNVIDSALEW